MTDLNIQATAMSGAQIEAITWQVREQLNLTVQPFFPVIEFLEHALPTLYPEFCFEIVESRTMGAAEGMNCIGEQKIILPENVYNSACVDDGRARFTVAHETGHLILHPKHRLSLSRSATEVITYRNPEWQANHFASCLLMPARLVCQYQSVNDVMEIFGVSYQAAEYRMKKLGIG